MPHVQQMISTHPRGSTVPSDLAACIEACFECAQTCTACADACLAEDSVKDLIRCVRLNLDCADTCEATGKILSRLTDTEPTLQRALLEACAEACRLCAEECERHAEMGMEHGRAFAFRGEAAS